MTEDEYNFIRQLESNSYNVLLRMSDIENIKDPSEIYKLHNDLEKITDKIHSAIEKREVKSPEALQVLQKLKMGYIEMLATTDELMS